MVNIFLKILSLFNLENKSKIHSNSPNKSQESKIILKRYIIKVILISIVGLSHGFIFGLVRLLLIKI